MIATLATFKNPLFIGWLLVHLDEKREPRGFREWAEDEEEEEEEAQWVRRGGIFLIGEISPEMEIKNQKVKNEVYLCWRFQLPEMTQTKE